MSELIKDITDKLKRLKIKYFIDENSDKVYIRQHHNIVEAEGKYIESNKRTIIAIRGKEIEDKDLECLLELLLYDIL